LQTEIFPEFTGKAAALSIRTATGKMRTCGLYMRMQMFDADNVNMFLLQRVIFLTFMGISVV